MALFIEVREYPKEGGLIQRVFLTNEYDKEELSERLKASIKAGYCSEEYVGGILQSNQLKEDYYLRLKHETVLTTDAYGSDCYCHYEPGDKLIIHPNGTWSVEAHADKASTRILEKLRCLLI